MQYTFSNYTRNGHQYRLLRVKDIPPLHSIELNKPLIRREQNDNDLLIEHYFTATDLIKTDTDVEGFAYAWYNLSDYELKLYNMSLFGIEAKEG